MLEALRREVSLSTRRLLAGAVVLVVLVGCGDREPPASVDRPAATQEPRAHQVSITAGKVFGRESRCGREFKVPRFEYVEQRVDAFTFDATPVTCAEWTACIQAGTCEMREGDACHGTRAVVSWKTATEYCAVRGQLLPSWAEWMRAVRGEGKAVPESVIRASCPIEKGLDRMDSSCVVTVANGIQFTVNSAYSGEWVRELDCAMGRRVPFGVALVSERIGTEAGSTDPKEFRCSSGDWREGRRR